MTQWSPRASGHRVVGSCRTLTAMRLNTLALLAPQAVVRYALNVLEKERELAASELQSHPLTFCANWTVVTEETELGLQKLDAYACLRMDVRGYDAAFASLKKEYLKQFDSEKSISPKVCALLPVIPCDVCALRMWGFGGCSMGNGWNQFAASPAKKCTFRNQFFDVVTSHNDREFVKGMFHLLMCFHLIRPLSALG